MSRILGIDYGLSNIGLAFGIGSLVEPFRILPNIPNHKVEEEAISDIIQLVDREGIDIVVIGIPYRNGEEAGHSKVIRRFAKNLRSKLPNNIKIEFVDETSTSRESIDIAIDAGISQKRRKADHAIAAGIIIKRWWEHSAKA